MGKVCLKCRYERQADDAGPDYACPQCGAIYAKVEAAMAELVAAGVPVDIPPGVELPAVPRPAADAAQVDAEPDAAAVNDKPPASDAAPGARAPDKAERSTVQADAEPVPVHASIPAGTHVTPPRWHVRWLWPAAGVAAAVLLLWALASLWWSPDAEETRIFRLHGVLATPGVLVQPDPLQGEASPPMRRLRAGRLFMEFYLFNTRTRPNYCQEHGVSLNNFRERFSEAHRQEVRQARAILANAADADAIYAEVAARLDKTMQADMKRLGRELDLGPAAVCTWLEARSEDVAWRMHIAVAAPVIKAILQLQ